MTLVQALHHHEVRTTGQGLVEITRPVVDWLAELRPGNGLLTLFCRHTSASLLIQENADPAVRADLESFFSRIAPEGHRYAHDDEGPDDMPAHLRTALTQISLGIPVESGRIVLGQSQGIYLFEHRRRPHIRDVVLHFIGDRS